MNACGPDATTSTVLSVHSLTYKSMYHWDKLDLMPAGICRYLLHYSSDWWRVAIFQVSLWRREWISRKFQITKVQQLDFIWYPVNVTSGSAESAHSQ